MTIDDKIEKSERESEKSDEHERSIRKALVITCTIGSISLFWLYHFLKPIEEFFYDLQMKHVVSYYADTGNDDNRYLTLFSPMLLKEYNEYKTLKDAGRPWQDAYDNYWQNLNYERYLQAYKSGGGEIGTCIAPGPNRRYDRNTHRFVDSK